MTGFALSPFAQSEGRHLSLSSLDRRITRLFFVFSVFNTFLGAVLGGAAFQQVGTLIDDPGETGGGAGRAPVTFG